MPVTISFPGVFIEELSSGARPIEGVPTSITAFIGRTSAGPLNAPVAINSFADFDGLFGGLAAGFPLGYAVSDFYRNGGAKALIVRLVEPGGDANRSLSVPTYLGDQTEKSGLHALDQAALFNILCIPPDTADSDTPPDVYQAAAEYCAARRAMLIIDPPGSWQDKYEQGRIAQIAISDLGSFSAEAARSAAVYFPRIIAIDPLANGRQRSFAASGAIAGVWAATDAASGVWKAPAGQGAALTGVVGLAASLTDAESDLLNPKGINALRNFPGLGTVVWGARTLRGADQFADEYKFIPVRRMALFIESSIQTGTQWAVFEPNDERLWAQLRSSVDAFMAQLFRQGAFQGATASQAFFVKCDATTTTQADIDAGFVNIQVGFAPLRPAEFVVLVIGQMAGRRDGNGDD